MYSLLPAARKSCNFNCKALLVYVCVCVIGDGATRLCARYLPIIYQTDRAEPAYKGMDCCVLSMRVSRLVTGWEDGQDKTGR
jgi:hypothetical protein